MASLTDTLQTLSYLNLGFIELKFTNALEQARYWQRLSPSKEAKLIDIRKWFKEIGPWLMLTCIKKNFS